MVGRPMFVLSIKLISLKPILKIWNKYTFENIYLKVTQSIDDVNMIQCLTNHTGYIDDLRLEDKNA